MLLESETVKNEVTAKPKFLPYIHFLRGLAILFIVGIHCRTSFPWPENSVAEVFFEAILDNGTIIFVFISGFLFEHLFANNFRFQTYLNKKLKYVVVPYLLVSILPIVDKLYFQSNLLWLPASFENEPDWLKVFYMLFTGKHFGPYWFIPMIVIFYLISPFLVWINNSKFYTYIFPIIFITGLFTYKFGYYSNTWDSFLYFFPIYLFGMWSSHYKERIINYKKNLLFPLIVIYLILTALEITGYIKMYKLSYFELDYIVSPAYVFNISKLKVILLCIALLLLFYDLRHKKIPFLKALGDYSFGIFFIHLYIIVSIQYLVHKNFDFFYMSFGLFLIYTLLVTILSITIVYITKLIFGKKSRYILGS